jgi:hypothetical protein
VIVVCWAAVAVAFAAFPLVVWRRRLGVWAFFVLVVVVAGYFVWCMVEIQRES